MRTSTNDVSQLEHALQQKYAHVLDELGFYYDSFFDGVFLTDLYIKGEYQGAGWGRKIMEDLIKFADEKGIPISLIPVAEGIPTRKLIAFYKSLGFIENQNNPTFDDMSMYRLPSKKTVSK